MNRTMKWLLALMVLVLSLSACSEKETAYNGKPLIIGVIGEAPYLKESNITFKEMGINELTKETVKDVDGVLVMKEHLKEASKEKYVDFYKEVHIPFFFIESEMGMIPFLEKSLEYSEENFDIGFEPDYAYGFQLTEDNNLKSWSFGLLDDKKSEKNMEDVFTRIFKTIGGEPLDLTTEETV